MTLSLDQLVDIIGSHSVLERTDAQVCMQRETMNAALWGRRLGSEMAERLGVDSWPAGVTRQELLEQAKLVSTPQDAAMVYARIAAWGTGSKARPVARAAKPFADPKLGERLLASRDRMRDHGPVEAYSWMLNGGALATAGLGPAFFSKWLYFCDYPTEAQGMARPPALILDQRVKDALSLPSIYSHKTYATYVQLAWAAAARLETTPHVVESSLFTLGRRQARDTQ